MKKSDKSGNVTVVPPSLSWGTSIGLNDPKYNIHAYMTNKPAEKKDAPFSSVVGLGWFHKFNNKVKIAYDMNFERNQTRGPNFSLGSEYALDSSTILKGKTSVKVTKHKEVRVGLGVSQKLSDAVLLTFGADLNASGLIGEKVGQGNSFGWEVKIS